MKIYPKVSMQDTCEEFKEIIRNSEGVEIQFFDENGIMSEFNYEDPIRKMKKEFPNLKEIIIHPPLENYNIEAVMFKNEKIVERQLNQLANISEELDLKLAIVYHTYWTKNQFIATHLADKLKTILKKIEGKNVILLIENLFMMLDERIGCEALKICKEINNQNLKMCLDTTHMHCKSNIWKIEFYKMLKQDLNKQDCEKFVYQVHFAATLENDGYVEKKTHGRVHENIEKVKEELQWLFDYGMKDKNYIIEISEDDYYSRKDQIKEIEMIKSGHL